jgi:hypothetical protein
MPPRCADCGRDRPLVGLVGTVRICSSCQTRRINHANPCGICGSTNFDGRDRHGQPRCRKHPPGEKADPAAGEKSALWLTERGGRLQSREIEDRFAAYRDALGLEKEEVHCLRHSHVTHQIEDGADAARSAPATSDALTSIRDCSNSHAASSGSGESERHVMPDSRAA